MEVEGTKCLQLEKVGDSALWHARLGYVGMDAMKTMVNKEMITSMPKMSIERETCASCLMGKQTRASFPKATTYRATHILELLHGDLRGPISPSTAGYMWSILLKEKSDDAPQSMDQYMEPALDADQNDQIISSEVRASDRTRHTDCAVYRIDSRTDILHISIFLSIHPCAF